MDPSATKSEPTTENPPSVAAASNITPPVNKNQPTNPTPAAASPNTILPAAGNAPPQTTATPNTIPPAIEYLPSVAATSNSIRTATKNSSPVAAISNAIPPANIPDPQPPVKPKRVRKKKTDPPTPKAEASKNHPSTIKTNNIKNASPTTAANMSIPPINIANQQLTSNAIPPANAPDSQPNAKPKRTRKKKTDPPTPKADTSKNPPPTMKTEINKIAPPMTAATITIPPINIANQQLLSVPIGSNVHMPPYYATNYEYNNIPSLTRPSLTRLFTSSASADIGYSDELSRAFEELRDNTWGQISRTVLTQAQQFDIPSLIGTLYTLRSENEKLSNKIRDLTLRREQLRTMNAQLDLPGSSFISHLSQTSPNFSSVVASLSSPRSISISSPIPAMSNSPIVSGGSYNYMPSASLISKPNTPNCKYPAI